MGARLQGRADLGRNRWTAPASAIGRQAKPRSGLLPTAAVELAQRREERKEAGMWDCFGRYDVRGWCFSFFGPPSHTSKNNHYRDTSICTSDGFTQVEYAPNFHRSKWLPPVKCGVCAAGMPTPGGTPPRALLPMTQARRNRAETGTHRNQATQCLPGFGPKPRMQHRESKSALACLCPFSPQK